MASSLPRASCWALPVFAAVSAPVGSSGAAAGAGSTPEGKVSCDLPRLDVKLPETAQRFAREFRHKKAVLLEGVVEGWLVWDWSLEDWQKVLGNSSLPLRRASSVVQQGGWHAAKSLPGSELLATAAAGSKSPADEEALVFTTSRKDGIVRELGKMGALQTPPILRNVSLFPVLSIGGQGQGLPYHEHDEAWLGLVQGRKQWYLRSPTQQPATARVRSAPGKLEEEKGVVSCLQEAGEVVYFPSRWWHATYNAESSFSGLTIGLGGLGPSEGAVALAVRGEVDALEELAKAAGKAMGQRPVPPRRMLREATAAGHAAVVAWMLEQRAMVAGKERNGEQAIHMAAKHGHVEVLRTLLEGRAQLTASAADGSQPIHTAAVSGHIEALEWLLRKGADMHSRSKDSTQALHWAAGYGGHAAAAVFLLDQGAQIDAAAPRAKGAQAIHLAATHAHVEALDALLERGADLTAAMASGGQALHSAAFAGHASTVEWLAARKANLDATDDHGNGAAEAAALAGHANVLRWLATKGIMVDENVAAQTGHKAVLAWLNEGFKLEL